ncbi:uncharacterized protein LOC143446966 [Clavelina lepadiformis]|uniref:uncharacterized protein LOC143446966 n=1 Tax=Clavelina lepadiformis TaxID=159417 RepID=UPI0040437C87
MKNMTGKVVWFFIPWTLTSAALINLDLLFEDNFYSGFDDEDYGSADHQFQHSSQDTVDRWSPSAHISQSLQFSIDDEKQKNFMIISGSGLADKLDVDEYFDVYSSQSQPGFGVKESSGFQKAEIGAVNVGGDDGLGSGFQNLFADGELTFSGDGTEKKTLLQSFAQFLENRTGEDWNTTQSSAENGSEVCGETGPCLHRGACEKFGYEFRCVCAAGYTGSHCAIILEVEVAPLPYEEVGDDVEDFSGASLEVTRIARSVTSRSLEDLHSSAGYLAMEMNDVVEMKVKYPSNDVLLGTFAVISLLIIAVWTGVVLAKAKSRLNEASHQVQVV